MGKIIRKTAACWLLVSMIITLLSGCANFGKSKLVHTSEGLQWYFGFGVRQILPDADSEEPLYIAGYQNGAEITGVLDYCQARALWVDTGGKGILLIGIDCIALDSGTIGSIRKALNKVENCAAVHVYATHTHAGPDTLGLWGPVGIDGKNQAYMDALVTAAVDAGMDAAAARKAGKLYYGSITTENMYRDSRYPQVYDPTLYQLRFSADNGSAGLRLFFYGAHAEALRGANTLLSRDFPGLLCDGVSNATGDNTMFFPGAIGGLIMTKAFTSDADAGAGALENLWITGDKLVQYALLIRGEREILPQMRLSTAVFTVPMDNIAFLTYRMLGILSNKAVKADSATGYGVETELSILMLGDIAVALIPGEIFPELAYGGFYGNANANAKNPRPLSDIAAEIGIKELLVIGLANDEIGYIVPPSDFLVNDQLPYLERAMDFKGEDHYEETNSVGPQCAGAVAEAFASAVELLRIP